MHRSLPQFLGQKRSRAGIASACAATVRANQRPCWPISKQHRSVPPGEVGTQAYVEPKWYE
eukprot:9917840-Lingulodinium_polyedra.AAC.1